MEHTARIDTGYEHTNSRYIKRHLQCLV